MVEKIYLFLICFTSVQFAYFFCFINNLLIEICGLSFLSVYAVSRFQFHLFDQFHKKMLNCEGSMAEWSRASLSSLDHSVVGSSNLGKAEKYFSNSLLESEMDLVDKVSEYIKGNSRLVSI